MSIRKTRAMSFIQDTTSETTCQRVFGNQQCVRLYDDDATVCEGTETACIAPTDAGNMAHALVAGTHPPARFRAAM